MTKKTLILLVIAVAIVLVIFGGYKYMSFKGYLPGESGAFLRNASDFQTREDFLAGVYAGKKKRVNLPTQITPPSATTTTTSFSDTFVGSGTTEEAGAMYESTNPYWWVNSGGRIINTASAGQTIQGDLSILDRWYSAYLLANPTDTDKGLHPQNIFRLVQTGKWGNFTQQAYFKVNKVVMSSSPNRNSSNAILLFNRYQSGDDLYYTGIRVDGAAVIKKKLNGIYYTMAYTPFIPGSAYNKDTNPSLIPQNTWIGLRSDVITNSNNTVTIRLYVDMNKTGNWVLAAQAVDDGLKFGSGIINNPGFAGIRTDFMDVSLAEYSIKTI